MEQLMEWELDREAEVLKEILPKYHSVQYKSHITLSGTEPGILLWEVGE
jgi:hypothetical protein